MPTKGASGTGPQISPDEATHIMNARERMIARHTLIEGMIRNNELQLKNESARGGAEIERASALRDAAAGTGPQSAVADLDERLRTLTVEQHRLVAEREWLNGALLDFEQQPSAHQHKQAGHA